MSFSVTMENFQEFFVLPDDAHDQVKVTWTPKEKVAVKNYYLEKSIDNVKFEVWKKTNGIASVESIRKLFEIDFEPAPGWSYYRIREELKDGKVNHIPSIPVFIGIERLKKAMRIAPQSLVKDKRQKVSLSDYDGKIFILVLRDRDGYEYLYDKPIRVNSAGLYIEYGTGMPSGPYTIAASSLELLIGLTIFVN